MKNAFAILALLSILASAPLASASSYEEKALADCDGLKLIAVKVGGLGPTGEMVNDLYLALRTENGEVIRLQKGEGAEDLDVLTAALNTDLFIHITRTFEYTGHRGEFVYRYQWSSWGQTGEPKVCRSLK